MGRPMGYHIPSESVLQDAIRRVLTRTGGAGSLSHLMDLVAGELQSSDETYRIGPTRLRRVASRMNALRTTIYTRRARASTLPTHCPVCGAELTTVRNQTLTGGAVALEARCQACPYWSGRERRVPVRYTFALKEWKFAKGAARSG